ncbi:MAG: hypothetical protein DRI57_08580 [Deltaproteobacteria bacterium]|nr:MAG: hypothetical protein DRI57_08580 [Deltaproteobacteria bacterium]
MFPAQQFQRICGLTFNSVTGQKSERLFPTGETASFGKKTGFLSQPQLSVLCTAFIFLCHICCINHAIVSIIPDVF